MKKAGRGRPAKPAQRTKEKPRGMRERPTMPPISEEMKQWARLLTSELSGWPQVSTRPMFGMLGQYRGKKIFAGLPVTRGFDTPNSIVFRLDPVPADLQQRALEDPRIRPGTRWFSFEIHSTQDLHDAIWWLNQAYERAK